MRLSKQQKEVRKFAEIKIKSLPKLNNRTSSRPAINQQQHPDFIYPLPNPTLVHDKPLGIKSLDPECFELLGSKLVLFGPDIYWFGLVLVRCPLCNEPAAPHGWCKQIRRVFALHNTYFLAGRRFKCVDCKGGWQLKAQHDKAMCALTTLAPYCTGAAGGPLKCWHETCVQPWRIIC